MERKELVLLLHHKRGVNFVDNIISGGKPELSWKEHENEFYVFKKGKDLNKAFKNAKDNVLRFPTQDEAEWFCENYESFKITPTESSTELI